MAKKSQKTCYDFAIIGGGLSGLIAGKILSDRGAHVAIFEGADQLGGAHRPFPTPYGIINVGSQLVADTRGLSEAVETICRGTGQGFSFSWDDSATQTFENGKLKEFLGFGKEAPEFSELIMSFIGNRRLRMEPHFSTLSQIASDQLNCDVFTKSLVSSFSIQDDKIISCQINGQTEIKAEHFLYASNWKNLKELIPIEHWGSKNWARAAKVKGWTAVFVDLLSESDQTAEISSLLLKGTPQDQDKPTHGQIQRLLPQIYHSFWTTFVPDDEAEDTEVIGQALKRIKRQIKQGFPELLEKIKFERISVQESWGLTSRPNQYLPDLGNLTWLSGLFNEVHGLAGQIIQIEQSVKSLESNLRSLEVSQTEDLGALEGQSVDSNAEKTNKSQFADSPVADTNQSAQI